MAKKEENLTEREIEIKQELAARRHLRKLSENRTKSLETAAKRVHAHYNKLEESYLAQLKPSVVQTLNAEDAELIEAEPVAE